MGIKVGKIVKEFVFKSLIDQEILLTIHGNKKELSGKTEALDEAMLDLRVESGNPLVFRPGEKVRVFFLLQNNYHTFESEILEVESRRVKLTHPAGVYKNPQRKFERVAVDRHLEASFSLKGKKVDLNFPKSRRFTEVSEPETADKFDSSSIKNLMAAFKDKVAPLVSYQKIKMLRNKYPATYEERLLADLGKMLFIPSVEEDFPADDPSGQGRVITKADLISYEEGFDTPANIITSKLGNLLYEKQKQQIYSELFCPLLYEDYLIGYIHCANHADRRESISMGLIDYVHEFSQVLSYALKLNGYFTLSNQGERKLAGQIIDISVSGLLFAHPQESLFNDLLIQTDMEITLKLPGKEITVHGRVRRKFKDKNWSYFGIQFLKINPDDVRILFRFLYGKPYSPADDEFWEGGAPPPPLHLFDQ
jgi:c-di-GMP-binding flagellar brake protein YcgR